MNILFIGDDIYFRIIKKKCARNSLYWIYRVEYRRKNVSAFLWRNIKNNWQIVWQTGHIKNILVIFIHEQIYGLEKTPEDKNEEKKLQGEGEKEWLTHNSKMKWLSAGMVLVARRGISRIFHLFKRLRSSYARPFDVHSCDFFYRLSVNKHLIYVVKCVCIKTTFPNKHVMANSLS